MLLTRAQVRELDRRAIQDYGVPGEVLMENAGRGAAELLISLGIHGRVVVCCGKGNNGGDGFVIARHLDLCNVPVRVLLFAKPETLTGEAAVNYRVLAATKIPVRAIDDASLSEADLDADLAGAEWIVDALFGTGLTGSVRAPLDRIIAALNRAPARVFAVDIPSGLDCDTGAPLGETVQAEHTATFVAIKKGFANPEARRFVGKVHVIDIGAPRELLEQFLRGT
jgi:NAD(P)H-hydrate epimerase